MIIRDHLSGDVHEDLAQMSKKSLDRRTVEADPIEFMQWGSESLREHRDNQRVMYAEHAELVKAAEAATIGLDRLAALARYITNDELQHIKDMHRTFVHNTRNVAYLIEKCKKVLDETSMTWQLVGETLVQPLADRQKKKGVQQEFGLRLRDIDFYYNKCKAAIEAEKVRNTQLSEGIQALMNQASIKLPPQLKKQGEMEDQVKQLALEYSVSLKKGKDTINPAKAAAAGVGKLKNLGDSGPATNPVVTSSAVGSSVSQTEPAELPAAAPVVETKSSFDYKKAGAIVLGSLFLGYIISSVK